MRKNDKKLMNQTEKKYYEPPVLEVLYVKMEQGIASSSAQIVPGGSTNTPTITDWDEKKDEQNWEF
ncbi:hypothetical protein BAZ12_17810 [Elizabethkingia miricola]|uniref:Uncharacterized protein n=1 Tax=Elizabethkingia miricola TaxID=172045 RepID=A0AAQ1PJJ2_ELIMR|nr:MULTISPECIES: hypothetical protein [Elizabethkingia]KUY17773.1 hypothetical protein ATB95_13155 [Elizabethkingia miricola]MCL1654400.1 hypothetical protein [Elizabethkingia miricola]MCL1680886.1 hypothetical protein [Elizabethkingia miricola]OPC34473.1 hypothetical protein BAX99_06255 [Elizabethkingia miricola]OPC72144.1 hypothetical protein BAZ13_05385 [Elizabethkingia miricola]